MKDRSLSSHEGICVVAPASSLSSTGATQFTERPSFDVSVAEFARRRAVPGTRVMDVRTRAQFQICALRDSANVPLDELELNPASAAGHLCAPATSGSTSSSCDSTPIPNGADSDVITTGPRGGHNVTYVICRRGIDSVTATNVC